MDKLEAALEQFDLYNRKDPTIFHREGESWPQEYFLSARVYEWVQRLAPEASEELLLAARAHHIGRWEIPRHDYPDGKVGYLNWRSKLAGYHAEKTAGIMEGTGYDPERIERVKQLILKKHLKNDPEVQVLENALCLVFLQFQYEDFWQKHSHEKVVNILRKSLLKMDEHGRAEALKLEYSQDGLKLVREALERIPGK